MNSKLSGLRKRKVKRFYSVEDALPLMYVEWLKTSTAQRKIVKKWSPRVVGKGLCNSFIRYCAKAGGKKPKQEIRQLKKQAVIDAKKNSFEEVKEAVKNQQVKSALKHVEFMDRNLNKSAKTIDDFGFDSMHINEELDILKKHDDLSRKAFGLNQLTEEVASEKGKLNLAVLINLDAQERVTEGRVLENEAS